MIVITAVSSFASRFFSSFDSRFLPSSSSFDSCLFSSSSSFDLHFFSSCKCSTSSAQSLIWAFNFALGYPFDSVFLFLVLFVAANGVDTGTVNGTGGNGVDAGTVNGTAVNGVDTGTVNGTAVVVSVCVSVV